jgi:hypothetical protein
VIRLDAVVAGSQNQPGVRIILLAAAAFPVLTGCQSAVEKQRFAVEAQSGDLGKLCTDSRSVGWLWGKLRFYRSIR